MSRFAYRIVAGTFSARLAVGWHRGCLLALLYTSRYHLASQKWKMSQDIGFRGQPGPVRAKLWSGCVWEQQVHLRSNPISSWQAFHRDRNSAMLATEISSTAESHRLSSIDISTLKFWTYDGTSISDGRHHCPEDLWMNGRSYYNVCNVCDRIEYVFKLAWSLMVTQYYSCSPTIAKGSSIYTSNLRTIIDTPFFSTWKDSLLRLPSQSILTRKSWCNSSAKSTGRFV